MIKCYAITQLDRCNTLQKFCSNYPLTTWAGYHTGNTHEIYEPHILFVDYALKYNYRHFLKKLSSSVSIIYLSEDTNTAYEAFEDGVMDHLIYPFSFERFELCLNKLIKCSLLGSPKINKMEVDSKEYFFVKPNPKDKLELLVCCRDLLFIEAHQNDIVIQMADGRKFLCSYTLKEMEEYLSDAFLRVHKSFIINCKSILSFDGLYITLESTKQHRIPLGGTYKKNFFERRNDMLIRKAKATVDKSVVLNGLKCFIFYCSVNFDYFGAYV